MNLIDGADASAVEAIFQSADIELKNHDISWDYCVAIGLYNTNVNTGDHNFIKSKATVIAGCLLSLHNALCKAGEMFSKVTNFDIEDYAMDLFHLFDKSSQQKCLLKEHY